MRAMKNPSTPSRQGRSASMPFRKRGFSHVLDQAELTPDRLIKEVISLYHDRGALFDAMVGDEQGTDGVERVLEQIYKYAKK